MEDNEFEEVTIISHTDHGTSVLPQSTAERLMKEIKLEVTQKISQNENVKLGSLQHSTTPTLLDSIYQNVLRSENTTRYIRHISHHPWNPTLHKLLLAFDQRLYGVDDSGEQVLKISDSSARIEAVTCWGQYIFVFRHHYTPEVFDWTGKSVKKLEDCIFNSRKPQTSQTWLYYQSSERNIIRVSTSLQSSQVDIPQTIKSVHDMTVREKKDRELIYLAEDGALHFGDQRGQLPHTMEFGWFSPLKQMYSDHFLVSFQDIDEDISTLHLVEISSLSSISSLSIRQFEIRLLLLLKPRLHIHPLVLTGLNKVQLAAVHNQTLHLLAKHEFSDVCVYCLTPLNQQNTWILGLGTGFLPKVASVEFLFPPQLKL